MVQDSIEREVRRRVSDALAEAGVGGLGGDRVAIEVLYMLPPEFVRTYRQLFDMALEWSPKSGSGIRDEASATRASGGDKRDPTNSRTIRGAQDSGGKRWRQMPWTVRSEAASEAKSRLDRRLVEAAQSAVRELKKSGDGHGSELRADGSRKGPKTYPKCLECGRGQASGWVRCPFH